MTLRTTRRERPAASHADDKHIKRELGLRLQKLRESQRLTQQDMAELTGMTVEGVGRIERAVQEPRLTTLYRLSRGLRLTLAALLDFDRLPAPTTHRDDVEAVARFLDDQTPSRVAKARAILELIFDES